MSFTMPTTPYGLLSLEVLRARMNAEQWLKLMQHAHCLACLDGNSYGPDANEQYIPEAYANLWSNAGSLDMVGLPDLYPADVMETMAAEMSPSHPQYSEFHMEDERRNHLLDQFVVDPRGNPVHLQTILDKATIILGGDEKAHDWVDHYSASLGDIPRRLSSTQEGTDEVMRHLTRVSQHGHDA